MTAEAFAPTHRRERTTNILNVRLVEGGWRWVEAVMEKFDINQTEVVKAALAFAAANPKEFAKTIAERKGQTT